MTIDDTTIIGDVIQRHRPPVDIATAAMNIMRVVDGDRGNDDRGDGDGDAKASPASRDLAAMLMFELTPSGDHQ